MTTYNQGHPLADPVLEAQRLRRLGLVSPNTLITGDRVKILSYCGWLSSKSPIGSYGTVVRLVFGGVFIFVVTDDQPDKIGWCCAPDEVELA